MQINGRFYEGTYHDAVGTYMFFEKDESPTVDDPVFDTPPTLKYFAKTRKLLKMERVFAMQRTEVLGDSDHNYCIPNMDTIREAGVPPKYQNDALQFWEKMRNDRMQALTTYLEKQQIREEKRLQGIELDSESDDDNPFAMYKPKKSKDMQTTAQNAEWQSTKSDRLEDTTESEDTDVTNILNKIMELDPHLGETENCSNKPFQKLTVIDPGPSTSKLIDSDKPLLAVKKKKKTYKVTSRTHQTDVFKKPNKRAPRSKKSVNVSISSQNTDKSGQLYSPQSEVELLDTGDQQSPQMLSNTNESEKDRIPPHVTGTNMKNVCLVSRRLEKQAKREAKMKEISERLKTHKEELLKMKNSNRSLPNSEAKDL
ncbi:uncharacterized protein LOC105684599 isoform X2 [Athalia rosae]|nr:uncharacterized protein LOC105684599 isoform X2 [Athalia rosae]